MQIVGLFDAFKAKAESVFNPQNGVKTMSIAAVLADGEASDEEIGRLRSMCARGTIFAENFRERDNVVTNFALNIHHQLGFQGVCKAAAKISQGIRKAAFAFAAEIVLADGVIAAAEESSLGNSPMNSPFQGN